MCVRSLLLRIASPIETSFSIEEDEASSVLFSVFATSLIVVAAIVVVVVVAHYKMSHLSLVDHNWAFGSPQQKNMSMKRETTTKKRRRSCRRNEKYADI